MNPQSGAGGRHTGPHRPWRALGSHGGIWTADLCFRETPLAAVRRGHIEAGGHETREEAGAGAQVGRAGWRDRMTQIQDTFR